MLKFFASERRRARAGFTLIELLVVIGIIGVLASVVLASLNSARKKARDARRVSDIKQIQLALELHFDSVVPNAYPATAGVVAALEGNNCGGSACIVKYPLDPLNTAPQVYTYGSTAVTTYTVKTVLESGGNPVIATSVEGTFDGVDCLVATNATRYCIRP